MAPATCGATDRPTKDRGWITNKASLYGEHWACEKLLALRAELAVRGGVASEAERALERYEEHAGPERAVRPALLRALWLRRCGDLTGARRQLAPFDGGEGWVGWRAAVDLELAECDLALGRCEQSLTFARNALREAQDERNAVLVFCAEAVVASAQVRGAEPGGRAKGRNDEVRRQQIERLAQLARSPPTQILPQAVFEVKLRWVGARLASGERESLVADVEALVREAVEARDGATVARAAFILAQAELVSRPSEALRRAEWVAALTRQQPIGGPPRHALEWLLASVHYHLKWFQSARALSGRAMESLRSTAHARVGSDDRERWLRSGDSMLIGLQR